MAPTSLSWITQRQTIQEKFNPARLRKDIPTDLLVLLAPVVVSIFHSNEPHPSRLLCVGLSGGTSALAPTLTLAKAPLPALLAR